ncbi:MAG: cation:proton antiporter, partial [Chloroflexota bacterium]
PLAIGIMVLAGYFAGRLAHWLKLPMITGYIVVGAVLSPSVLNVINNAIIERLGVFTPIALGIVAYSIGGRLHIQSIRQLERSILTIVPLEALGAALLSLLVVTLVASLLVQLPEATYASVYLPAGLLVERTIPVFSALIFNAILTAVILNELIAPPLVKLAIFKAKEHHME